jgi:hypothetical protein
MSAYVVVEHAELLPAFPGGSPGWRGRPGQPDLVLYASSAEIGVLFQQQSSQWIQSVMARHPFARHAFVSMACTGWYATILEFMRSPARNAHVYLLEIPVCYTQAMLDSAGQDPENIPLLAQEGVARVVLSKKSARDLRPDDIRVAACSILAKPHGLNGTQKLLLKMRDWLNGHLWRPTDWVSFHNASSWSRRLMGGFEQLALPQCSALLEALPSFETDSRHWLTVTPVLEYLRYRDRIDRRPLALATLGAGGRVGFMLLGRADQCDGQVAAIMPALQPYLIPAERPAGTGCPFYCLPQFRFRDDRYFLTELQPAGLAAMPALDAERQRLRA